MYPEHLTSFRVRYSECDPMGYLHHSRYVPYFEMGRIELLRSLGHSYADLEARGILFVVIKVEIRYKTPVRFDDEITLLTKITRQTHVRIDHAYEMKRGDTLVAEGSSTIACVNREGQLQPIPAELLAT